MRAKVADGEPSAAVEPASPVAELASPDVEVASTLDGAEESTLTPASGADVWGEPASAVAASGTLVSAGLFTGVLELPHAQSSTAHTPNRSQ